MGHRVFDNPNSIEARQFLLDRRCERTHPKRHRTTKRRIKRSLAKKKRADHKSATNYKKFERFHDAVRAYWSGETDTHPTLNY